MFCSALMTGCVEHRFFYNFRPEGKCDLTYAAQGDSTDIYHPPIGLPDTLIFQLSARNETDSTGKTTHILEARRTFNSDHLPSTFALKEVPWTEVLWQHPTRFRCVPLFFVDLNSFQQSFQGRHRDELEGDRWKFIPAECHLLEESPDSVLQLGQRAQLEEKYAAGLLLWNVERYKLRFRQIVTQALALHPELTIPPAWVDSALTEADSLVEAYSRQVQFELPNGELDMLNLEWWASLESKGNQVLQQNLNLLGDSSLQAEIPHIAELLELQHQVSEDLTDESFQVKVSVLGWVFKTNSGERLGAALLWKFSGADLQNRDISLKAASLYFYPDRSALLLFLIILLAALGKYLVKRRKTS